MPEAMPKIFKASGDVQAAVVCLHGFGGMPYEVNPVAAACAVAGLDAITVLLPGHGYAQPQDQRREFARLTRPGLLTAARETIAQARKTYRRVGVFGLSTGGAIALLMAAESRIDACAVGAAALRLPTSAEILIPLLSWASFYLPKHSAYDFYVPTYSFHHSRALRALWQVSKAARSRLANIACPVYAAHSHHDAVIPPVVMNWLERDISSSLETAWFDDCGHCLPLDVSGAAVSQDVAEFMVKRLGLE